MTAFEPVRFGLVGIGGYGSSYLNSILTVEKEGLARLSAVVVRTPGKYPEQEKLMLGRGLTFRSSLQEMLELDRDKFDIAAIPTGIDSHRDLMISAVSAGFNVVLEKPSAATIQDLDAMEEALRHTGRWCSVGFQSQFAPNIVSLKREISAGQLGEIREVVVKGLWMRDNHYYERNAWAGRLRMGDRYILDGTINNPMAHYLFNALYFASREWGQAAVPRTVRAELYHAHEIESEDTSCLEIVCANGAKVYFYGTLAAAVTEPIVIEVIGTKERAVWDISQRVRFYEGDRPIGQIPEHGDTRTNVFRNAARFFRGEDAELFCPLAMTRAHVLAVNGAFVSAGKPRQIPAAALQVTREEQPKPRIVTAIKDVREIIERAARERKLFSDVGVRWATSTRPVDMTNFRRFELPA